MLVGGGLAWFLEKDFRYGYGNLSSWDFSVHRGPVRWSTVESALSAPVQPNRRVDGTPRRIEHLVRPQETLAAQSLVLGALGSTLNRPPLPCCCLPGANPTLQFKPLAPGLRTPRRRSKTANRLSCVLREVTGGRLGSRDGHPWELALDL